jgi:hypothetical protein
MKLQQSFKKPLATFFIFVIGIFAVSGLSYISTVMGAPSNPPNGNAFIPINEGSQTQGRCQAKNTANSIRTYESGNNLSGFYSDCKSSNDGTDGAAVLFTSGFFVKTPNTSFQLTGDPSSNYKGGALYVGCTSSTLLLSQKIVDKCGGRTPSNQPSTYLYGDINMVDLVDPNQVGEKQLCLDKDTGAVKICP